MFVSINNSGVLPCKSFLGSTTRIIWLKIHGNQPYSILEKKELVRESRSFRTVELSGKAKSSP